MRCHTHDTHYSVPSGSTWIDTGLQQLSNFISRKRSNPPPQPAIDESKTKETTWCEQRLTNHTHYRPVNPPNHALQSYLPTGVKIALNSSLQDPCSGRGLLYKARMCGEEESGMRCRKWRWKINVYSQRCVCVCVFATCPSIPVTSTVSLPWTAPVDGKTKKWLGSTLDCKRKVPWQIATGRKMHSLARCHHLELHGSQAHESGLPCALSPPERLWIRTKWRLTTRALLQVR